MLDHIGLRTKDVARSLRFYSAALEPLGYRVEYHEGDSAGLGKKGSPKLWLGKGDTPSSVHLALEAADRGAVDAFYQAAIKAGASDNGAPGIRADYSPGYYAAYVVDPDGNNLEAVFNDPKAKK
jgi:catechol 2,3-dioxygenase-like lactoylglutathione lyase family enzyme